MAVLEDGCYPVPVDGYLHHHQADSPERLAAALGLPVLVPDLPLHHRGQVHYVYAPDDPSPQIWRHMHLWLESLASQGTPAWVLLVDWSPRGSLYYQAELHKSQEQTADG